MNTRRQETRNYHANEQCPEVRLTVAAGSIPFFTTLLQSGIEIETPAHTPLGRFLCDCPGFSEDYLSTTVQTIFLDGSALDDLQTPLPGKHPVVALSAAMPGLAGAIFRKNSLHAALRTPTTASEEQPQGPITVTLKLFNRIAREKGEGLLSLGVVIRAAPLSLFLATRPELRDKIIYATLNGDPAPPEDLPCLVRRGTLIRLFVSVCNEK